MEETSEACGDYRYETDPAGSDYDVFLSFRGPDTRHGITDHLYESMTDKGIRVFRDDEEIRRGEEIGGELERAIHGSRVYVVVFSRTYASSAWCLRELSMMMDCRRDSSTGKIILPIFYDVDPYDVKLRTELYRSALVKHRERYGDEGVKRWEDALVKVGGISGWDYKGYQGEGKFVRLVVQDVLSKLKIRDRRLPDHLLGIDDRVDSVMNMLHRDSPEVQVVMVHGMGGIGKTTLANVIFNRICSQFEGCSFLPNVRESSAGEGGIAKLQKKLLGDILGGSATEVGDSSDGMNQIKKRLGGKRVLIMFDDVSERSQLDQLIGNCDFFGSGTIIIVTTRDKGVCKGLTGPGAVYTYEMEEMSDDHALQLFSRHAFGGKGPLNDLATLSKQVVRTTGNLPLALEVIGGHLRGESKDVWEYTLQKLKRVPHKDVMKILLISYEGLEESEKQIFLDIACFLNEMPKRYANYMWEACDLYPKFAVAVLLDKSLVKVFFSDEEFWMHDQIRDMGREIVRLQGLESLGLHSRLWAPKDALNVVRQKEGTSKVLAINLGELSKEQHFGYEEFEGMSNLRFLQLRGGQFIGDFRNFQMKLMWLCWEDCEQGPNPAFFNMNNLIVLTISGRGITDESMKDLRMGNLRALEIFLSPMTTMPDLAGCSKLERIIIKHCHRLGTLHCSLGKLENLTSLHIKDCPSLRSLPEELGSAKALEEFSLMHCRRITELPDSIGRLGALRVLRARFIQIRTLPASIGNLKSLEVLEFAYCPLDEGIPLEIGGLSSLEELILERCNLRQLPETIHQLSSLRSLSLSNCHKPAASLTKQRVESPSLELLSEFSPTNLTELVLDDCDKCYGGKNSWRQPLQLLGLGMLPRPKRLDSCPLGIQVLPPTELGSLSRLKELNLFSVDMSSLQLLPLSLRTLVLSDSTLTEIRLGRVDMLGNLTSLTIESCFSLEKLLDLACLKGLRSLHLSVCPVLVDISGVEEMKLLEELTIRNCHSLRRIPDLLDSTRLKGVHIFFCDLLLSVPCMIGECDLEVDGCGELASFRGPYRLYHHKRKREAESIRTYFDNREERSVKASQVKKGKVPQTKPPLKKKKKKPVKKSS